MCMNTKQKVMVFIARPHGSHYDWLTRRNAPHLEHGGDRWYVVTGNVESGEPLETAAIREVQEETGINSHITLIKLPIIHSYISNKDTHTEIQEQAFLLVTANNQAIRLNEESTDYLWLQLDKFIDKIWWPKDRQTLKNVLAQALGNKK